MSYVPITGASRWLTVAVALILWSGCSLHQPLQREYLGDLGHFEFRNSDSNHERVVVGVPRGTTEPTAINYAEAIRLRVGAGLVVAYDFAKKRLPVAQPLIHQSLISWSAGVGDLRTSVYPEFAKLLESTVGGRPDFFVGIRLASEVKRINRIEIASSGLSFDQLKALKEMYAIIRDRAAANPGVAKIDIAINPLDEVSWQTFGVKNHGVLALAEKGLVIRLPTILTSADYQSFYPNILAEWVAAAIGLARLNAPGLDVMRSEPLPYGRIDSLPSKKNLSGVVIAAPHGSFDWYTSDLVERVSYRTSIAAVVTKGFTPTECGGWRIDVNRPTERRYPTEGIERVTERSQAVFKKYSATVFKLANGPLDLYIEMHQNGDEPSLEVATLGISNEEALAVTKAYREIRDRVLMSAPEVAHVDLLIEPIDQVSIGAWAAKERGLLRLAKQSFHFELPAQKIFYREATRRAYVEILTQLVERIGTITHISMRPKTATRTSLNIPE